MEQFSQSACCTLAEDLGHLKGQEKSHNWVGLKEEKKKKRNGMVPAPLMGAEGQKRFYKGGSLLNRGEISWDRV